MRSYSRIFIAAISILCIASISKADVPGRETNDYTAAVGSVQGGELTDGRDLRNIRWGKHQGFERIVLDIYEGGYSEKGPPVSIPCPYTISYEHYPFRFVVELNGIRARNARFGLFKGSDLVQETYQIPYLDDSGLMFSIALKKPVEYRIFELHNPARIVIDIRENKKAMNLPAVYSVRSKKDLGVEGLGHLKEVLNHNGSENVRIIKSQTGDLFVEEGYYLTKKAAEERMKVIQQQIQEAEFFIEKTGEKN